MSTKTVNIKVRFFASCREAAGAVETMLRISEGENVSDLMKAVCRDYPRLSADGVMLAVNREFVDGNYRLKDGDEVALLPPVSGG